MSSILLSDRSEEYLEEVAKSLPEFADQKKKRYIEELGLPEQCRCFQCLYCIRRRKRISSPRTSEQFLRQFRRLCNLYTCSRQHQRISQRSGKLCYSSVQSAVCCQQLSFLSEIIISVHKPPGRSYSDLPGFLYAFFLCFMPPVQIFPCGRAYHRCNKSCFEYRNFNVRRSGDVFEIK